MLCRVSRVSSGTPSFGDVRLVYIYVFMARDVERVAPTFRQYPSSATVLGELGSE